MVAAAVLGAVLAGAGFAVAAAWQEYRVATHPLRAVAAGSYLTVGVVVGDDPKLLRPKSFGGRQLMVRANLREYRRGEASMRVGGAVVVIAPENGWSALLPGQVVEFRARVESPWRPDLTVAVLRATGPPTAAEQPPWWQRAAGSLRTHLAEAAAAALPPDSAGLLPGLVDGDVSRLPDHVRDDFTEVAMTHLVAVSGMNLSIVLAAVLVSARMLAVDLRWSAALAALALLAFVIIARPSPSVLRAAAMGAIAVCGLVTGRRKQALPALCAAVIGLIGYWPRLAVDAGFALSVLATAGLILLAPGWSQWLQQHGWHRVPAEAFSIAAAAFLVTTPIIVGLTGHLAPHAILANVLVEPVIAPITVLGVIGAVLSCVWMPGAEAVLWLTGPLLWWLLQVAEKGAALDISLSIPDGLGPGLAAAAIVTAVVAAVARPVSTGGGGRSARCGDRPCHDAAIGIARRTRGSVRRSGLAGADRRQRLDHGIDRLRGTGAGRVGLTGRDDLLGADAVLRHQRDIGGGQAGARHHNAAGGGADQHERTQLLHGDPSSSTVIQHVRR
ncbi:ComEC/Rec2 family competence protein [Nocardia transvalensis]|uniref:ComEC/Rec2 family competence protein n=1 Tax=Nocardia transvalensis TaxID=37333 RepID=UPI002B4B3D55|nr:ComEC/Rec2 family competence protein [Nocardia transvalensis]